MLCDIPCKDDLDLDLTCEKMLLQGNQYNESFRYKVKEIIMHNIKIDYICTIQRLPKQQATAFQKTFSETIILDSLNTLGSCEG